MVDKVQGPGCATTRPRCLSSEARSASSLAPCMSTSPAYVRRARAGEPTDVPSRRSTSGWEAARHRSRELDIDLRRLLHGGQEYVFHGPPPRAGSRAHLPDPRRRDLRESRTATGGTMTFVETVTEFRDSTGTLVAEARSTAIETGQAHLREGG